MQARILLVDDELEIQELLRHNLEREGFSVTCVGDGERAVDEAKKGEYDLALLDVMLPGIDGLEVCRRLKNDPSTDRMTVIMLSARGEDADIVTGLEMGADNYLTKPFSPPAVVAMVRAALRQNGRGTTGDNGVIKIHGCTLHPGKHELRIAGHRIDLTLTEFRILRLLMGKPGWVFSRYQIVDKVHGSDHSVTDRAVDIQIVNLRRKMGAAGENIETVRGIGYRFRAAE